MLKITFTYRGYITGVFYNRAATECEAIAWAALYCSDSWDTAQAERV